MQRLFQHLDTLARHRMWSRQGQDAGATSNSHPVGDAVMDEKEYSSTEVHSHFEDLDEKSLTLHSAAANIGGADF